MTVELRLCRSDIPLPVALREHYLELLSDAEKARCARLEEPMRQQMELTRALVRTTLAEHTGIEARALRFAEGPHGKPVLEHEGAPEFNLSHCNGHVVLAVGGKGPLGVDIETRSSARRDPLRVARRFFTEPEVKRLESLNESERSHLFLDLWTLKEAWVKAHGLPLAPYLSRIGFDPEAAVIGVRNHSSGQTGSFLLCRPEDYLRLSLCLLHNGDRDDGVTFRLLRGLPLQDWHPLEPLAQKKGPGGP